MKTKILFCALAIAGLLLGAGLAQAEELFSYDFENLPYGKIFGHDGWQDTDPGNPNRWEPAIIAGVGDDTTKVFASSTDQYETMNKWYGAERLHNSPLEFTTADNNIEISYWGRADKGEGNQIGNLVVSMMWEGASNKVYGGHGIYFFNGLAAHPETWFRNSKGGITRGDTLVEGDWFEIKSVVDFSQLCDDGQTYGKVSLSYRNITEGETEFTPDSIIQNMDLNAPMIGGKIKSNGVLCYVQNYDNYLQHQFIDNISVTRIPEPSTLALLACGLMGLLAYAWKRRR